MEGTVERFPVVALVASEGGLEALLDVVSRLPQGFPGAVIVLRHQSPDHVSHLPRILARRCTLPIEHARQGEPLRPGRVLVAPPGKHVLVTVEGTVALVASGAFPPHRPSADLLLVSLAITMGPRAIVAVLSGGGHDGATGATAVHDLGGTVLAANRLSSLRYAMPEATVGREDACDAELHVREIAAYLTALVGGPPALDLDDDGTILEEHDG